MTNSGIDHQDNPKIQEAAEYLAGPYQREGGRAAVPELRSRFGISAAEAIEAIRIAQAIKMARAT
ncbi:hypothetical protein LB553_07175 [Mesorhizobium sp. CA8]|uniref:hypothetical protein n=1 Tax=Mesorhizobium sp. CA8 TaxID=2876637 RepID=UPI001CCA62C6|nr:hypothetical protein [Mesorhizobium sp. CA8]MBZ9760659.1 hypothetical protein [Mesorhizobium sp. CA8]